MNHIPNALSFFRIALIPFFVGAMLKGNTSYAAILLAISGITDLLDGFLARKFEWVTQMGKVLDPVADKLTQVTVCVVLAIQLSQYWSFFAVLMLKDLVMMILGGYLLKKGMKMDGARWFGKVVTALFYVCMFFIVICPDLPEQMVMAMLSVVTGCALAAALMYVPEFLKCYHDGPQRDEK